MPEINYSMSTTMTGAPRIRKIGAVSPYGEMSPFVWKGLLMRLELIDNSRGTDSYDESICAAIRDVESGEKISCFGRDCYYFSGYLENGTYYVVGTIREKPLFSGDTYKLFWSEDLFHWNERILLSKPGFRFYNSGLCKGEDGYVLVMEASEPREYVGDHPFTCFFAKSADMGTFEMMPWSCAYPMNRYIGGPFITYTNGYYYLIGVESLPCARYANYIYRTRDFHVWEIGYYNPLLMPDDDDRCIAPHAADMSPELLRQIPTAFLSSSSDVDLCEFQGRTVINYAVGNQLGFYYMVEAIYEGPVREFLESFFR